MLGMLNDLKKFLMENIEYINAAVITTNGGDYYPSV